MFEASEFVRTKQSQLHWKLLWISLMFLTLTFTGNATHAEKEITLVLNDPTQAPYTTQDKKGFFDVIAGEAFRRAGLRLELVKLPAERGLMNANAGIEDGDLSRIAGMEKNYPDLVRIPEKMISMDFVAFSRQPKPEEASWAVLAPFSVGYIKGWKIFENNLPPVTQTTTADNPEQLLRLLEKNRIDVALYDRWMGTALATKMQLQNIRVVEPPLASREMFIYLHKRHADKIPAIAAALRAIKAEGMYTRVCREKFAPLSASVSQCEVK
jgi:polar amino acid transport system substrate-binding protein